MSAKQGTDCRKQQRESPTTIGRCLERPVTGSWGVTIIGNLRFHVREQFGNGGGPDDLLLWWCRFSPLVTCSACAELNLLRTSHGAGTAVCLTNPCISYNGAARCPRRGFARGPTVSGQTLGLVYRLTEFANPPMSRKLPPSCSDEST